MSLNIKEIFKSFSESRILVVGDSMIDAYVWGEINRMSPEAPVPLLNVTRKESRVGGAANVALNLKSLGADVKLFSVIGDDFNSQIFIDLLKKENIKSNYIVREKGRITTVKKRIISEKYFSRNYNKHHIRIDDEVVSNIKDELGFINLIKSNMKDIDAIILQDYNKGNLTKMVIERVISEANKKNIPTLCDPKNTNFYSFKNCTLIKPNLSEIMSGGNIKINLKDKNSINEGTQKLLTKMNCKYVMLTMSENGMFLKSKNLAYHFKNIDRKIIDVSGAGDTVISVASVCLSRKLPSKFLGFISNLSGGIVCEESGVVKIDKNKLLSESLVHYNKN